MVSFSRLGGIHSGPQVHMGEYIGCMHVHESAIPSLDIHSGHPQGHLSIPSIPNLKALATGDHEHLRGGLEPPVFHF